MKRWVRGTGAGRLLYKEEGGAERLSTGTKAGLLGGVLWCTGIKTADTRILSIALRGQLARNESLPN